MSAAAAPGMVHIVGAGPGPADLLSLRALDRIRRAEVLVHDRLIGEDVLALVPATARRVRVGRAPGHHAAARRRVHALLIGHARAGRRVVRLEGGDPQAPERGGEQARALRAAGIAFEVVPGILPTHRDDGNDDNSDNDNGSGGAPPPALFSAAERASFHRLVAARRDMRHFTPASQVPEATLRRLLAAAHHAPSVGLMQPWRYVRVVDAGVRARIARLVDRERAATADALGPRADEFLRLKVEGVRDCAELLVVALAPDDGTVFGRRLMPRDMSLCSLACSVQNLWLAARADNLGLGWVSMFEPAALAQVLGMPEGAQPVGVLCLGPVDDFYAAPLLELERWRKGRPLHEMVMTDRWPAPAGAN